MRNIGIGQVLVLLLLCFLLFGDAIRLKKSLSKFLSSIVSDFRKKRNWTPDFWFWKPLFCRWTIFLRKALKSISLYRYYLEIKFRVVLLFMVWLTTFLVSYFFKEALLYIITTTGSLGSLSYIFTGITEVFSVYILLFFFIANQVSFLYFSYYVFLFILPSLTCFESTFLVFTVTVFYSLFFLSFLVFSTLLFPLSWDFFLSFQQFEVLNSFSLEFEAKLSEYSIFYTRFYIACFFYFQVFLVPILFLKFMKNSVQFYFRYRKLFCYFGVLFSTLLTPPDVLSQVFFSLIIFICCEILVYCFVLKRCFSSVAN